MAHRILVTDYAWRDLAIETAELARAGAELRVASATDEDALVAAAEGVHGILTNWARVTRRVLDAAPELRIVARLGIGLDNIDVEHATARGIVVTNVPDYCVAEVAEHALALLFALARNVAWFDRATNQGRYDLASAPPMHRIEGRTLGIVGLGNIGRALSLRARGLGLRVVATGRRRPADLDGIEWRSLEALLAESDFVSLHVPATRETRHLIGDRELASMKEGAFLINTARGAVVDSAALGRALGAGRIAGAALDVQDPEPPDLKSAPWNDQRVIVTPHAAFVSEESLAALRTRAARQVADVLSGKRPENVVNPEVLGGGSRS
jgi:D-3-phosphoglycerate dehydrogenase / 2-oxoglutarate reductase